MTRICEECARDWQTCSFLKEDARKLGLTIEDVKEGSAWCNYFLERRPCPECGNDMMWFDGQDDLIDARLEWRCVNPQCPKSW